MSQSMIGLPKIDDEICQIEDEMGDIEESAGAARKAPQQSLAKHGGGAMKKRYWGPDLKPIQEKSIVTPKANATRKHRFKPKKLQHSSMKKKREPVRDVRDVPVRALVKTHPRKQRVIKFAQVVAVKKIQ